MELGRVRLGVVRPGRVWHGSARQGRVRKLNKEAHMKETTRTIKASRLVFDYSFYPREEIRSYHVRQIVEALEAGAMLPPIVVDRKSKRVVDGFHRVRAYQEIYGQDAKIPVILKTYETESEMFAEAVALNATHGWGLTPYDRARAIARAEELKMEPAVIAKALNMTPEHLAELKATRMAFYQMKPTMLKRTTAHLAGDELTEKQLEYNRRAGGMSQTFYINQVIAMLEADAVDWERETVVKALKHLHQLLSVIG